MKKSLIVVVLLIYSNHAVSASRFIPALLKEMIETRAKIFAEDRISSKISSHMIPYWILAYKAYVFNEIIQKPNRNIEAILNEASNAQGENSPFVLKTNGSWKDQLIYPHFNEACLNWNLKEEKVTRDWLTICANLSVNAETKTGASIMNKKEKPILPLQFLLSMCNSSGDTVNVGNVVYKNVNGVITTQPKSDEIIVIEADGTTKHFTPDQFQQKYGVDLSSKPLK